MEMLTVLLFVFSKLMIVIVKIVVWEVIKMMMYLAGAAFMVYLAGTWVWDKVLEMFEGLKKIHIRVFAGEHEIDLNFKGEEALRTWLDQNKGTFDFYERRRK